MLNFTVPRKAAWAAGGLAGAAVILGAGLFRGGSPGNTQAPNDIAGVAAGQSGNLAADRAYIRAHPVPARAGMAAGIITSVTELGDQPGTGLDGAVCLGGADTTAYSARARGQDPCVAWRFSVVTVTGATVVVSCGDIGRPCLAPQNVMPGEQGEYLYVPLDGQVTPASPLAFMGCWTPSSYPCPPSSPVEA